MEPEFFQAIEEHFRRLHGERLILSPRDWHLAADWWERDIPLPVVLRAIDEVFEKTARRAGATVRSLAYCRYAVEVAYGRNLELTLGQGESGAAPGPGPAAAVERLRAKARRIDTLAGKSSDDARHSLERAARDLRAALDDLTAGLSEPPEVENILLDVEERMVTALLDGLPPEERLALEATCTRRLARYSGSMSPDVYALTRRRCLETEMRRQWRLPRLSLLAG